MIMVMLVNFDFAKIAYRTAISATNQTAHA